MKILLFGYGKMGKMLEAVASENDDVEIVGSIDVDNIEHLPAMDKVADVIIDFSHPDMLKPLCAYALRTKTAVVSGTTSFNEAQLQALEELGKHVPVLYSSNYSFGIALFRYTLERIRDMVPDDFDIEIIETHHNKKIDAPSGTAKTLLSILDEGRGHEKTYGREGICGARKKGSIGVHSIRGGTVPGEHRVAFFGKDEVFEIMHRAESRRVFAEGAISAARKLAASDKGFYSMEYVLRS